MPSNRGKTSLKSKRRNKCRMADFDVLPSDLRAWIVAADLPWAPSTVQQAFDRAFSRTGDRKQALQELDRIQQRLVNKDAKAVWGHNYPIDDERSTTQTAF